MAPIRKSVDFPCFCGSIFVKPFAFKVSRPVDNLLVILSADPMRFCPLSGVKYLFHSQCIKFTMTITYLVKREKTEYILMNLSILFQFPFLKRKPSTIRPQDKSKASIHATSADCGKLNLFPQIIVDIYRKPLYFNGFQLVNNL